MKLVNRTVAPLSEVAAQDFSFSIPLYVRRWVSNRREAEAKVWLDWKESGQGFWQEMDNLVEMLERLAELKKVYRFGKLNI